RHTHPEVGAAAARQRLHDVGAPCEIADHHLHSVQAPQCRGPLVVVMHQSPHRHTLCTYMIEDHASDSADCATDAGDKDRLYTHVELLLPMRPGCPIRSRLPGLVDCRGPSVRRTAPGSHVPASPLAVPDLRGAESTEGLRPW